MALIQRLPPLLITHKVTPNNNCAMTRFNESIRGWHD